MTHDGNFYELLTPWLHADAQAPCMETEDGTVLARAWLHAQSGRYANALVQAGCRPGDRVAAQVDKSPEALALYLACVRAGFVFLPLNTAYPPAEAAWLIADARPRIFVHRSEQPQVLGLLPEAVAKPRVLVLGGVGEGSLDGWAKSCSEDFSAGPNGGDDAAVLLYTSGTTGRPKGALLSHRAMAHCALTLGQVWQFQPVDVLLHALPIFHGHGLFVSANVALVAGASLLFLGRFDVDAVIDRLPRATVFMGVPTHYHRLLASPRLAPTLCRGMRLFTSGSAPLSAVVHRSFEACTGHRIVERYGATETMILCSNPLAGERRPGSVGLPLPGVDLRIADKVDRPLPTGRIGMIQARSPGLFEGYWNLPGQTRQEFSADGYFRTGDLGCVDAGGYVTITGRAKDLIISGGYNVYPAEVEAVIGEMPGVHESAVVGVPHADFGEAVLAFVVPADAAQPPTVQQVMRWCTSRLAKYKVPKSVRTIAELPRNAMGKILKARLREMAAAPGPATKPESGS